MPEKREKRTRTPSLTKENAEGRIEGKCAHENVKMRRGRQGGERTETRKCVVQQKAASMPNQ